MFTLPERLLLTAIDERGRPRDPNSSLGHALAGAALTELLLSGRLRLERRADPHALVAAGHARLQSALATASAGQHGAGRA